MLETASEHEFLSVLIDAIGSVEAVSECAKLHGAQEGAAATLKNRAQSSTAFWSEQRPGSKMGEDSAQQSYPLDQRYRATFGFPDVAGDLQSADDLPGFVADRRDRQRNINECAVLRRRLVS